MASTFGMSAGSYGADGQTAPMRPLPGAVSNLGGAISGLAATVDVLVARLERVLVTPPPATANNAKGQGVSGATCQMVQDLDCERQRIDNLSAALNDVLSRLDV